MGLRDQIREAAQFVQARWPVCPRAGVILGTGLGRFSTAIRSNVTLDYEQIPHFPSTTALGHAGRLIGGEVSGVPVLVMEGRFHRYEGYCMQQITLPVRVMRQLGIDLLILSNASGGVHPRLASGDIVAIDDHVNLMWGNPLIGPNDETLGPRFPDLSAPYDAQLLAWAIEVGQGHGIDVHRGVYAAMTGPNYETRAEYRFLRRIGVDVVGMSTVPEVLVAAHAGMKVLALSAVTNVCRPDQLTATSGAAVLAAAESTEPKLRDIVTGVLARWVASA